MTKTANLTKSFRQLTPLSVALGIGAAVLILIVFLYPDQSGSLFMVGVVFIGGYFVPTIVAQTRNMPNVGGVLIVNLLTGWTGIGWIIALVMACMQKSQPVVLAPQPHYRPGDIVGGWLLTDDGRWVRPTGN